MTDTPSSLYTAWLDALPAMFRALLPAGGTVAAVPQSGETAQPPLPFPADQVGNAMNVVEGLLTQLYQAWLPLLAKGELSAEPLQAIANAGTGLFKELLGTMARPLEAWPGAATNTAGSHPLLVGFERSFGGLGDAFGLRPMRDLEEALRAMAVASLDKQRAQVEYLALVAQGFNQGTQGLLQELAAMGARGERIESLLVFIRQWARSIDGPMHDTMQSPEGLAVTAKVIRASTQHRLQLQKAIGLASDALQVPTRADIDEAYREIQELKREMRRLKKSLAALASPTATTAPVVAPVAPAAPALPARKTAARRAKEKQA
jgi:hypothetical protein